MGHRQRSGSPVYWVRALLLPAKALALRGIQEIIDARPMASESQTGPGIIERIATLIFYPLNPGDSLVASGRFVEELVCPGRPMQLFSNPSKIPDAAGGSAGPQRRYRHMTAGSTVRDRRRKTDDNNRTGSARSGPSGSDAQPCPTIRSPRHQHRLIQALHKTGSLSPQRSVLPATVPQTKATRRKPR